MHLLSSRPRGRSAALVLAVVAAACGRDQVTAPSASLVAPTAARHTTITNVGVYAFGIPSDNTNGAVVGFTNTGLVVPAGSYYRIRVRGTIAVSPNPAHQAAYPGATYTWTGSYGPGGTGNFSELLVNVRGRNTNGSGTNPIGLSIYGVDSAVSSVQYASTETEIQAGRNGIAGSTNDNCCYWNIGFYSLSGQDSVTVDIVSDFTHVTPNYTSVSANTVVTFTGSIDNGWPMTIYSWHWQPDSGAAGNPSNPCWDLNPCQLNVQGSGTMTMYTNGGAATAHISVP